MMHSRQCAYVTNDGPAPCTCGYWDRFLVPTIHLNGTPRETLLEQHSLAYTALREAISALQYACPNGRDYYPQGPSAITAALAAHSSRVQTLEAIAAEILAIGEAI